jgi:hypothetical protein
MDRRRSTRLSGENASTNGTAALSLDIPLVGPSSSTTKASRNPAMLISGPQKGATALASMDVVESDLGMSGTSTEEQPAKKRQKTTATAALNVCLSHVVCWYLV